MGAAEHGADFPMARKLRASMSHEQLHDFASTKESSLPDHVDHQRAMHHLKHAAGKRR